ncbi:hypothetical protein ACFQJ5_02865 [Halomicroarcula sp. GCM10025324]|uniref:hypothetical protein n=1 Tax=Haloarcula TaxID=2237 RepID=UPI0023E79F37|nr:hypothetical protein [Halomicroarcula sp. ZS-22-S1]
MGTTHWQTGDGEPTDDPSEGVLPAVIRTRSDGTDRFICYDDAGTAAAADTAWLSVNVESAVSLLDWR